MNDTIKVSDTQAVATHFRGNPKFGRTTTLIHKGSGQTLFVAMGAVSRAEAFAAMRHAERRAEQAGR